MASNDQVVAELRRLNEAVSQLLDVVRVTAYPGLKAAIRSEFATPDVDEDTNVLKRKIYALCDGKNSSRHIEGALGGAVGFRTVARYQQQWRKQGLASAVGGQGKTKALFDLEDFGLEVSLDQPRQVARNQVPAGE